MQVYASMEQRLSLGQTGAHAQRAEALGYDGLNVPDAVHDGLVIAHEALRSATRLRGASRVLVVFPRRPDLSGRSRSGDDRACR